MRHGGLEITNPCREANREYQSSVKVTMPLVEKIVSQTHELPDDFNMRSAQQAARSEREKVLKVSVDHIKNTVPRKVSRSLDLAGEKGASIWLSVVPMKEMGFNLKKREFRDAIKLRYDWPIDDIPRTCVCSEAFSVDHAMICKRGGFVIKRHNELRDIEAELLNMVCSDVQTEPVLQDITGEQLSRGTNRQSPGSKTGHSCTWILGKTTICLF